MMKLYRTSPPAWLGENWKAWEIEFKEKKKLQPNYTFQWRTYQGVRTNHLLLQSLKEMTHNHCSYCDGFPMGEGIIKETIDHFRPKSTFPHLVYHWENLFLCCSFCQERGNQFEELLLKPDEGDYDFYKYFIIDFRTYEIVVNPQASPEDKVRADITIRLFQLNAFGRPNSRKREAGKYQQILKVDPEVNINDFSYRFILT